MKRIGLALSVPCGPTQRRAEYGVYDNGMCQFEGYRETREDGEARVGLSPSKAHLQPFIPFVRANYPDVVMFNSKN